MLNNNNNAIHDTNLRASCATHERPIDNESVFLKTANTVAGKMLMFY